MIFFLPLKAYANINVLFVLRIDLEEKTIEKINKIKNEID